MRALFLILTVAAILSGCASGPKWKKQVFSFSLPADPPPATNSTGTITGLTRVSISPMFQSRSFTYRTGENSYEQDPYASFLVPPERALAECMRAWMRAGGAFGRVVDPGSGITPTLLVEASINELYGDFRKPSQPLARMAIHVTCYQAGDGEARHIAFERFCARETPLARKTAAALMAAWDADLREIMNELNSEYAKTVSNER